MCNFLVNSAQGAFLTWRVPPIWTWQILDFSFPHAHEVYEPVAHGEWWYNEGSVNQSHKERNTVKSESVQRKWENLRPQNVSPSINQGLKILRSIYVRYLDIVANLIMLSSKSLVLSTPFNSTDLTPIPLKKSLQILSGSWLPQMIEELRYIRLPQVINDALYKGVWRVRSNGLWKTHFLFVETQAGNSQWQFKLIEQIKLFSDQARIK